MWLQRILVCLLVLLGMTTPALAVEILYPADGTYVTRSDALVIKAGDGVDGLVLEIGGVESDLIDISGEEYRALFKDLLIVEPFFDPGKNRVRVLAYTQGEKVAETAIEFYYQADQTERPPENYQRFLMHVPEREALCRDCHNLNPTAAELDLPSEENPCVSCHRGMLRQEWVHGPAGAFQCGSCHELENEKGRFREKSLHAPLCNECHQDIVDTYQQSPFVHGPVAVGLCNVCHDSHASPNRSQLIDSTNRLCLGCHEGIDKVGHIVRSISGKKHPLEGVKDPSRNRMLDCTGCHNPHFGNSRQYFQAGKTSRLSLCQLCHAK